MLNKIILASKSKVRKEILDKHNISCEVKPSYVDEDMVITISSSTYDGLTSQDILCLSSISFLTLLLDARIILFSIV